MQIIVDVAGERRELQAESGQTVLDVLQAHNIEIKAPCGGLGKCGKCQVMVHDEEGLSYHLACQVDAVDGLEVVVERVAAIEAVETGTSEVFDPDEGATGFGMALDVGTTTLAAHLHNLATGERLASASRANPQSAFGADVISRITASVEGKLDLMTSVLQDAASDMLDDLCKAAGVSRGDVVKCTLSGNTVMQHIACGLAPDSIGVSPFTPLSLFGDERTLGDMPPFYFTKCIASYVGGDITAGMIACGVDRAGTCLFLDLGTNGEMTLFHDGQIYACATAAGPVFEGANIHFGMPALPGAVSKVAYEDGQLKINVLGDVDPVGVCGTGIVDAVAVMIDLGVVDERGYLNGPDEVDPAFVDLVGVEESGNVFYLDSAKKVYITQIDVRNVQLAKAAVCGGVLTLFQHAGIDSSAVERLLVAGGFGAFISMHSAARIGLVPPELEGRATSVGNASAEGAAALLVSSEAHEREQQIVDECTYIELSNSKEFNQFYVEKMMFDD
ncbi:MAG: DUF4445 domain-containing protein [Eggerthellaceae bacterium]|nr:DUF4445 domain-containing protein [Eggerthellaceae bacterium]